DGERFTIFGEGGGQLLADELDVPLLGKVPLQQELREHADAGSPLVVADPDAPASQAIRNAARGIVATTPQELPVMQAAPAAAAAAAAATGGTELPVVPAGYSRRTRPARASRITRGWSACTSPTPRGAGPRRSTRRPGMPRRTHRSRCTRPG